MTDLNDYADLEGENELEVLDSNYPAEPVEDEDQDHEYLITATVQFIMKEPHESWAMIGAKDRLNEFIAAGHAGRDPLNGAVIDGVQMLDGSGK